MPEKVFSPLLSKVSIASATLLLATQFVFAGELPQWRPDGTAAARETPRGTVKAWPNETSILERTPSLKVDDETGFAWMEFDYKYFAPSLSPRCEGLKSRPLKSGLSVEDHLRSALSVTELQKELGRDADCIRSGRGWIREDRLRPWTPPRLADPHKPQNKFADLERGMDFLGLKNLTNEVLGSDSIAPDLINAEVGECIVTPSKWSKTRPRNGSGYDKYFAPYWDEREHSSVKLPSGRVLAKHDLRAIDAITRTLYGEVHGCQFDWRQDEYRPGHFETVGRLIADRSEAVGTGTFFGSRDFGRPSDIPVMEQVVSKAGQFNNWDLAMKNGRGRAYKRNGALLNTLCPRNERNKSVFVGPSESFSKEHDEIWRWALEIATQMYLNRTSFQTRYPWNVAGSLKPDLRVMYFTHGKTKPSSRYARFRKLPVEGVGPYRLEFAPPVCQSLHAWKAVPHIN
ncbi:MAG: hypothetical protein ABL958_15170 [Bdellovibrionia bacterium]